MRKLNLDNEHQAAGLVNLKEVMAVLKTARIEAGLSQKAMADIAGISISTVSKYERGLFPTRLVWIAAMFHVLGVKMEVGWPK